MVECRCPYCGHFQAVDLATVGQNVGCMNARCDHTFPAYPERRHTNVLSRVVFCGVILFAAVLLLLWTKPNWSVLTQWVEWVKR